MSRRGSLELTQSLVPRNSRQLLEMIDTRVADGVTVRTVTGCELGAGLSPAEISVTLKDGEVRSRLAKLSYADGKLRGAVAGQSVLRNLPAPVVTDASLLRFGALVPFEEGALVSVQRIEVLWRDIQVHREERLLFDGRCELELREGDVRRAARIVRQGDRRSDRWTLWYDEARRFLLQVEGRTRTGKTFVYKLAPVVAEED